MRAGVRTAPPPVAAVALAEARDWLGLSTSADDARLAQLLAAATDLAEAHIGQALIARRVTERLPAAGGWRALSTEPVVAIDAMAALGPEGSVALGPAEWAMDIDRHGTGHVRVLDAGGADRVEVAYAAGLAADWTGVPEAVRHGILRVAADLYRARDAAERPTVPCESALALWRPWRRATLGATRRRA